MTTKLNGTSTTAWSNGRRRDTKTMWPGPREGGHGPEPGGQGPQRTLASLNWMTKQTTKEKDKTMLRIRISSARPVAYAEGGASPPLNIRLKYLFEILTRLKDMWDVKSIQQLGQQRWATTTMKTLYLNSIKIKPAAAAATASGHK